MSTLHEIKKAADWLVSVEDYRSVKREVVTLSKTASGVFAGDLAVLNPLVDLGRRRGLAKLNAVLLLVENTRAPSGGGDRKRRYQRVHMRARRQRLSKAVQLYEKVTGKELTAEDKSQLRHSLQAAWMAQRDEVLEGTDDLPRSDKSRLIELFWEEIESDLDAGLTENNEQRARKVLGL
jgi:hypothetical protein